MHDMTMNEIDQKYEIKLHVMNSLKSSIWLYWMLLSNTYMSN